MQIERKKQGGTQEITGWKKLNVVGEVAEQTALATRLLYSSKKD